MQVHAEGRDRPRARLGVGSGGGEARASEGLLDTGRERRVEVEVGVRVLGDAGVVNSSEAGGQALGGRRRRGAEGQLLTALLESAALPQERAT